MCAAAALVYTAIAAVAADAPLPFRVRFNIVISHEENGYFDVDVHPNWAPIGAGRFRELVESGFYTNVRFFRVISGFMAQFGIPGKPSDAAKWRDNTVRDDPVRCSSATHVKVKKSNTRGFISFATSGVDSRTTQMFINFADNSNLDAMGFSPFAKVVGNGMKVVDKIYAGYGEGSPGGNGPDQGRIQMEGNKYLKRDFPMMSYITSASILKSEGSAELRY